MLDKAHTLTVYQCQELLRKREVSASELVRSSLESIRHTEPILHALVTVCEETAVKEAEAADKALGQGFPPPLTGIPMVLKDNMCTRGVRTTCSSKMLENFVPPFDSTVACKLKEAGCILVGKSNMDEFAMGSSTEHSAFFTTHNPWDLLRVPGGSSGGSAVAVAADQCQFALGSDTGGSIRQPAGFCNVVGLKPTYGRVSRYGLVAFASSLDQIGPLTKDVRDCAIIMNAIAGHDMKDSTSSAETVPDYTRDLGRDIRGMRIGVPKEYFVAGMQADVASAVDQVVLKLEGLGARVDRGASLPHTKYALAAYYIIAPSEASANLARYDGVKYGYSHKEAASVWQAIERTRQHGFGPEVKRRIMLGTHALSSGYYDAYYLKAQKVRTKIKAEFDEAWKRYDALVTPTSPTVPFRIGERLDDPLQMYLADVCTLPINIAGVPAISVPAGFCGGLPAGVQFIGRPFGEETLLRLAYAYEQASPWHEMKPALL